MTVFDLAAYRQERIRRLERENAALRRHREQLEGLLASTLRIAVAKTGVDPLALASILEQIQRRERETPAELVARVLRETAA